MKKWIKWVSAVLLAAIVFVYGFCFTVREGTYAIVSRFGDVRKVCTDAGLYLKLPSPFEKVITFDARSQYMDSGYTETLTNDKKNVILQTYMIWHVEDLLKFYTSVADAENVTAMDRAARPRRTRRRTRCAPAASSARRRWRPVRPPMPPGLSSSSRSSRLKARSASTISTFLPR